MQVVVEAQAIVLHGFIERALAGMPKWGMAYIVRQGQSFSQVLIQAQRPRNGARDLRHFHGVGQAAAKVVRTALGKDLGFAGQSPKRSGMDDAAAIALEGGSPGVIRLRKFPLR
jgi:hypothetical protein